MASLRAKTATSALTLLLLIGFLGCLLCSCSKRSGEIDSRVSVSSPCVLVSQPSQHSGQRIELTGYVTSTKEGAYMWGEGCKSSGVVLHMGRAVVQDTKFQGALHKYGLSASPIKATLVGRFQYARFSGVMTFDADKILKLEINPTDEQLGPNSGESSSK